MTRIHTTEFKLAVDDGLTLNGCVWRNDAPRGIILFMHGIESHLGWFQDAGASIAQQGFTVYGLDRRGSGKSEGTRGHMKSFRHVVADMHSLVRFVRGSEDAQLKMIGLGLSLGSNFWSSYSILHPGSIDGIVMVGPANKQQVEEAYEAATAEVSPEIWVDFEAEFGIRATNLEPPIV